MISLSSTNFLLLVNCFQKYTYSFYVPKAHFYWLFLFQIFHQKSDVFILLGLHLKVTWVCNLVDFLIVFETCLRINEFFKTIFILDSTNFKKIKTFKHTAHLILGSDFENIIKVFWNLLVHCWRIPLIFFLKSNCKVNDIWKHHLNNIFIFVDYQRI